MIDEVPAFSSFFLCCRDFLPSVLLVLILMLMNLSLLYHDGMHGNVRSKKNMEQHTTIMNWLDAGSAIGSARMISRNIWHIQSIFRDQWSESFCWDWCQTNMVGSRHWFWFIYWWELLEPWLPFQNRISHSFSWWDSRWDLLLYLRDLWPMSWVSLYCIPIIVLTSLTNWLHSPNSNSFFYSPFL